MTRSGNLLTQILLAIVLKIRLQGELFRYQSAYHQNINIQFTQAQAFFNIQSISVSVTNRSNCISSSILQA